MVGLDEMYGRHVRTTVFCRLADGPSKRFKVIHVASGASAGRHEECVHTARDLRPATTYCFKVVVTTNMPTEGLSKAEQKRVAANKHQPGSPKAASSSPPIGSGLGGGGGGGGGGGATEKREMYRNTVTSELLFIDTLLAQEPPSVPQAPHLLDALGIRIELAWRHDNGEGSSSLSSSGRKQSPKGGRTSSGPCARSYTILGKCADDLETPFRAMYHHQVRSSAASSSSSPSSSSGDEPSSPPSSGSSCRQQQCVLVGTLNGVAIRPGQEYLFRIMANNEYGDSGLSPTLRVTMPSDPSLATGSSNGSSRSGGGGGGDGGGGGGGGGGRGGGRGAIMPAANSFDKELDEFINGGDNRAYAARYEGRTETERWTIFYDKRRDLLKRLAGEAEFHQHQARIAAASIADAAGGSSSSMHPVVPRLVLKVRRDKVLMDSFAQLRRKPLGEMRLQLHIEFEGEDGIDSGGLTKEWFLLVSKELFTPQAHACLFKQLDVESGYVAGL